jgi:predicted O-methyltransferase YrrM
LERLFSEKNYPMEIHRQRDIRAGHLRGCALEFGLTAIAQRLDPDPVWSRAMSLAKARGTLLPFSKLANLYLILRYGISGERNVIEFGSFRGGSALFMASILRDIGSSSKVYALDTFEGMPPTDATRDTHRQGEFADCDLAGLQALAVREGLQDRLVTVAGRFENTLPGLLAEGRKFALAHVDCDIYSGVKYATQAVKAAMQPNGYIIFDDALVGSCLGAFDAVAETLIQQDRLLPEQVFPHLVFRFQPLLSAA